MKKKKKKYSLVLQDKHVELLHEILSISLRLYRGDFQVLGHFACYNENEENPATKEAFIYLATALRNILIPELDKQALGYMLPLSKLSEQAKITHSLLQRLENHHELVVTEDELRLLSRLTNIYSRLWLGQFDVLDEFILLRSEQDFIPRQDWDYLAHGIKVVLMTKLEARHHYGASFGIYSTEIDERARQSFDMHQVIRHQLWKDSERKSRYTVDAYEASPTSDLPPIEIREEGESDVSKTLSR